MVISTRTRALPMAVKTWTEDYGAGPTSYNIDRHVESTTSEWGRNNLAHINSDRFRERTQAALRRFDWGHYFYSKKSYIDERYTRYGNIQGGVGSIPFYYSGGFLAVLPADVHRLGDSELTESQLRQVLYGVGATAISRTIPHASALDLGVTLGELRQDGLPRLPELTKMFGDLKGMPKRAASEYLNYEFAWKPLVSDVLGILEVAAQSERIYEQYKRDSGRHIRRRYSFPDEHTTSTTEVDNIRPYPRLNLNWWEGGNSRRGYGRLSTSVKRTSKTWFSGSYRYHIPEYSGIRGDIAEWQRQARVLYGLDASPELLWQLTRFSWLSDWFANFGDILANVSALGKDNLTLHYGYVMRHTKMEVDYKWSSYYAARQPANDQFLRSMHTLGVFDSKIRVKASPYGFGLDPGIFSPRQWAILTALGITMAPNKLL